MSLFILLGIWEARHFFVSWNKSSQTWVTFPMAVTTISSQTSELFAQRDSTKVWVVNYRRRVPPPHNMFPVYFLMQTKKVWESIDNVFTSIEKMCRGVKGCGKNFAMKCFVFLRCTCSALYCSYLGCLSTQTRRAFGIASILVSVMHNGRWLVKTKEIPTCTPLGL